MVKKKKLYISVLISGLLILAGWKMYQAFERGREVGLYGDELKKCEWIWENRTEFYEKTKDSGVRNDYGYDGITPFAEEKGDCLVYCIQDLNRDGMPELIVGVHSTDIVMDATEHFIEVPKTWIMIIYRYQDGKLESEFPGRDSFEIYKGGIIEYTCRMYGEYPGVEHHYYRYMRDSGRIEELENLGESDEELKGKEPTKFFRVIDDEHQIEITKEEYDSQKELYTGAGKEDLQWRELKGFLEGGETFESLFEIIR